MNDKSIKALQENVIHDIVIHPEFGAKFYFDNKNKQLVLQSPPHSGKIYYIPFEKIKEV